MIIKITNEELTEDIVGKITKFPKYTTQIMNLANQNAQGTRPKVVGQLSDLIQEFPGEKYEGWVKWYEDKMPNAIDNATDKIYDMIIKLEEAIKLIDKELIRKWVGDLVLTKTFVGLCFQESILKKIASIRKEPYRLAKPGEESKGIDGYIGSTPVSIKPTTYKAKDMLSEGIDVKIIYYDKVKGGIKVDLDL